MAQPMGMIYLMDTQQRVRAPLVEGVERLLHHEHDHTLEAAISIKRRATTGEYIAMECVDGLWRLFCITKAEHDDGKSLTYITADDAAVDDLAHIVVQELYQEGMTARQAVEALISGTDWALGVDMSGSKTETMDAQWQSLWDGMQTIQTLYSVRILPHYVVEGGRVTAKRIDIADSKPVYRGRFYQSQLDATAVVVTHADRPVTVLYGVGKTVGVGDEATKATFADAVWSIAEGDPTDKPAGQTWVEDTSATAVYGRRERVLAINDVEDPDELLRETWDELQKQKAPKVSVSAQIQDMEQLPGMAWKKVRVGDEIIVRTTAGEDVKATITAIDRDYRQPERTKIKAGDEMTSAKRQIAALTRTAIHTRETLTMYRNQFLHDEALIQLNADTIQANAELIYANAQQLTLVVGELDEQEQLIQGVQINVDAVDAKLESKAEKATVDEFGNRLYTAESVILQQGALIDLKASVEYVDLQRSDVQITLDALKGEIALKADLITLDGYVKASELEAKVLGVIKDAEIGGDLTVQESLWVEETLNTQDLIATYGSIDDLDVQTINGTSASNYATKSWVQNNFAPKGA